MAAFGPGELLEELGDIAGAKAAYEQAIDSGDAKAAAEAANNLGRLKGGLKGTPPPATS